MKIAVYTSCALNYYAKARALADSIARNSPNTSVTLCLSDEPDESCDPQAHGFARMWQPQDLGYDRPWIFQHNIMELCTGVKGRALERLMLEEPDADLFIYLDPDVYVYNDLAEIDTYMGEASIGLVPHILSVETTDIGVQMTEMSVTEHGIYNLGHLIVRPDKNGRALARWWAERLDKYCFDDKITGLFTDQRWMDLVPSVFEGVKILRVPNLDVASWNIAGRSVTQAEAGNERSFRVDGWPLITYHFSGTGPTGTHRRVREIFDPSGGAMAEIERHYESAIARFGQKRLEDVTPAYDFFDDGEKIPAAARKMYRLHEDLRTHFPDPYLAGEGFQYIDWLRENRPGMMRGIRIPDFRLDHAFGALFDANYYLARYADAREAVEKKTYASAEEHYVKEGSALLYDPCEFFISRYYMEQAKYLEGFRLRGLPRSRKTTVLWHYLTVGLPHGLEPIEFFDSRFYISHNPDLEQALRIGAISSPLGHYLHNGSYEHRQPCATLNPKQMFEREPQLGEIIGREKLRGVLSALLRQGRVLGRPV